MGRFNQCFLNDDDNGNWTIETPEHSYGFTCWQNQWIMTDENGNTVDSFPPFSILEEDEAAADGYEIHDDGADSPRVIGKVAGGTENALDGAQTRQRVQTPREPCKRNRGRFRSFRSKSITNSRSDRCSCSHRRSWILHDKEEEVI